MERFNFSSSGNTAQKARAADDTVDASQDEDSRAPEATSTPMSVLGKTLVFKGELKANEDLLIQGRVEGSITHTASNLAIGPHGDVKADITARRVVIQGKLTGDVRATESVVVEVSATVVGNIFAPRVSLKEGAKFRGSIDMDVETPAVREPSGQQPPKRVKPKDELSDSGVEKILG
jgi:cytoskeletal protein CcmA (bactofilin family)